MSENGVQFMKFIENIERLQREVIAAKVTVNAIVMHLGGQVKLQKDDYEKGLKHILKFEEDESTGEMIITAMPMEEKKEE